MSIQYPTFQSNPSVNSLTASAGISSSLGLFTSLTGSNTYVSGNVGIRTTSPTEFVTVASGGNDRIGLDVQSVASSIYLGSNTTGGARLLEFDRSTGLFKFKGRPDSGVFSDQLTITIGGNVGIGTITPNGILTVQENTGAATWVINAKTDGVSNDSGIYANSSNDMEFAARNGSGVLTTRIGSTGNSYISSSDNGNFGIGTTTPAAKLDVQGTGRFTSNVQITGTLSTSGPIYASGLELSNSVGYSTIEIGGPNGAYIDLKKPYSDDYDIRLITDSNIESGGYLLGKGGAILSLSGSNVGIGTYSPQVSLDISSSAASVRVKETNVDARISALGGAGNVGIVGTYSNHGLVMYTNATEKVRIDTAGNVGIGTTNPARPLQIGNESGQQIARIAGGSAGTSGGSAIYFGAGASDIFAIGHYSAIMGGTYNDAFTLFTAAKNTILNPAGGNVGIATATPTYKLDVSGTGRFTSDVEITGTLAVSSGIRFPATMVSSSDPNTLDEYEEGSWIPTIASSAGTGNFTYYDRIGRYVRIGSRVFIQGNVACSGTGSRSGEIRITDLPFAINMHGMGAGWIHGGVNSTYYYGFNNYIFSLQGMAINTAYLTVVAATSGSSYTVKTTDISSSTSFGLAFFGSYNAA